MMDRDPRDPIQPVSGTVEAARRKHEDRLIAQLRAELEMWNQGITGWNPSTDQKET